MSDPVKVADAFLCSRDYPIGKMDRDFARNEVFGPALGSERVHSREVMIMPESRSFVTRHSATEPDFTDFMFAKTHPRHPEMRHSWFIAKKVDDAPGFVPGDPAKPADFAGQTILIGFLKDDKNAS